MESSLIKHYNFTLRIVGWKNEKNYHLLSFSINAYKKSIVANDASIHYQKIRRL